MSSIAYAKPMIPNGLLHEMFEIKSGAAFQQDNGGQAAEVFGELLYREKKPESHSVG